MLANDAHAIDALLGPLPKQPLFAKWFFLLTCTIPAKRPSTNGQAAVTNGGGGHHSNGSESGPTPDVTKTPIAPTSTTPFIKEHLRRQIEAGGGVVFEHFEDVPKGKYRYVKLVAAQPCSTAKYVQCMAADIKV